MLSEPRNRLVVQHLREVIHCGDIGRLRRAILPNLFGNFILLITAHLMLSFLLRFLERFEFLVDDGEAIIKFSNFSLIVLDSHF